MVRQYNQLLGHVQRRMSYPLVAIGGYKGCVPDCDCASIRAYTLDTTTAQLQPL